MSISIRKFWFRAWTTIVSLSIVVVFIGGIQPKIYQGTELRFQVITGSSTMEVDAPVGETKIKIFNKTSYGEITNEGVIVNPSSTDEEKIIKNGTYDLIGQMGITISSDYYAKVIVKPTNTEKLRILIVTIMAGFIIWGVVILVLKDHCPRGRIIIKNE